MKRKIVGDEEFHSALKDGAAPADAHLRKGFISEIKAIDDNARTIDFVISTASVDRMGDTIAVDGWKLENFRKNPVVLWAHDSSMMPVGKASNVRIEDGKLKARAEFMPREISGFANAVYEATKAGFLSATSVGFAPLKYAFSEEPGRKYGIDFIEQELLEFSIVPIPANAEALIEARSAGIDIEPFKEWAHKLFAQDKLAVISQERLDALKALPEEFRTTAKRLPDSAKGAGGVWRRVANTVERALNGSAPPASETNIVPASIGTPVLDMYRRRMAAVRARLKS